MTRTLTLAALLLLGTIPLAGQDSVPTAHAVGAGRPRMYDALAAVQAPRVGTATPTPATARAVPRVAVYDSVWVSGPELARTVGSSVGEWIALGLLIQHPLGVGG